jgi:serine protease Do
MNGVDVRQFDFDFEQTWAILFLHADGTVYGRYGTRAGAGEHSTTHVSIQGLKATMRRVLELHTGYPANRTWLEGKQSRRQDIRRPEDFPRLAERAGSADAHRNCIHCHMVATEVRRQKWETGRLRERDLFSYPLPEAIGLRMDRDDDLRIMEVKPASPAEQGGLRAGDMLRSLAGHLLVSQADIQWVLQESEEGAVLPVGYVRHGAFHKTSLTLPRSGWRRGNFTWREGVWALRPGVRLVPLDDAEKDRLGLKAGQMALRVEQVFPWDPRGKEAGFQKGDVLTAVNSRSDLLTEEELLAYLWLEHPPGSRVRVTLRRGDRPIVTSFLLRWVP